jgi:hypothetical protein
MKMKYSNTQHREYVVLTRKIGMDWLEVFGGDTDFFSTHYWDLLTEMWYADKPVMVSDALKFMRSIKSPFTSRKYLQKVIESGLVIERKNPNDDRSMLVELSKDMRKKIDEFFDKTVDNTLGAAVTIKGK